MRRVQDAGCTGDAPSLHASQASLSIHTRLLLSAEVVIERESPLHSRRAPLATCCPFRANRALPRAGRVPPKRADSAKIPAAPEMKAAWRFRRLSSLFSHQLERGEQRPQTRGAQGPSMRCCLSTALRRLALRSSEKTEREPRNQSPGPESFFSLPRRHGKRSPSLRQRPSPRLTKYVKAEATWHRLSQQPLPKASPLCTGYLHKGPRTGLGRPALNCSRRCRPPPPACPPGRAATARQRALILNCFRKLSDPSGIHQRHIQLCLEWARLKSLRISMSALFVAFAAPAVVTCPIPQKGSRRPHLRNVEIPRIRRPGS